MIYTYKFADGTTNESEVSDKMAAELKELDRIEYNNNQAESRRHASLEAFNLNEALFPADTDIEADVIDTEIVNCILSQLTPRQKYLLRKIVLEGWKYAEIASFEGKYESAVRNAVERAKNKIKKSIKDRAVLPSAVTYL